MIFTSKVTGTIGHTGGQYEDRRQYNTSQLRGVRSTGVNGFSTLVSYKVLQFTSTVPW